MQLALPTLAKLPLLLIAQQTRSGSASGDATGKEVFAMKCERGRARESDGSRGASNGTVKQKLEQRTFIAFDFILAYAFCFRFPFCKLLLPSTGI